MLVTMLAQRYGVTPRRYARTRTLRVFVLDVRALAATWTVPLNMVLGSLGGTGGGAPAPRAPRSDADAYRPTGYHEQPYPWYRRVAGRRYNVMDLGPIEGVEDADPDRLNVERYRAATSKLRKELGGAGLAVRSAPLQEVPAAWRAAG